MLQISDFIQTLFLIFIPLATIYLERKGSVITKYVSPVLLCYLFGIIAGNIHFFHLNPDLSTYISYVSILIAIPVLLFSTNLIRWLKLAPKTVLAFSFNIISVLCCSIIFGLLIKDSFTDSWKLSGMLVGVYTGGTPNMSAIGIALHVTESFFVLVNAADVILGGIYLIFLLTAAKKLLGKIMPGFKNYASEEDNHPSENSDKQEINIRGYVYPVLISIMGIAISYEITVMLFPGINIPFLILLITSLGIGLSFIPKIRENKGNYPSGEFFILVFT